MQTQIHIKIFHLSAEAVITHHLSFHSSYLFREKAKASKKSRKRIKRDVMCAFNCETAASKKMTLSIFRMLHTLLYLQMSNVRTKLITFLCYNILRRKVIFISASTTGNVQYMKHLSDLGY